MTPEEQLKLDNDYKQAIITLAKLKHEEIRAIEQLAVAIRNMPTTIRTRPF